jgi:osmoprotectant transport system permease protein
LFSTLVGPSVALATGGVSVGSKAFTEGVILGELSARLCASGARGAPVDHRRQLGGSVVLYRALVAGEIDAYVEYTGTLAKELVHVEDGRDLGLIRSRLAASGIATTEPLGFGNTYALAVRESLAKERGLTTTSDLARHSDLVFGLSHEIVARADGFPGLRERYGLSPREVRPMDHDVAYRAVASGGVDVTDVYTTDAEIPSLRLRVLDDDRGYFPSYRAILLYRKELEDRAPGCVAGFRRLEGRIDEDAMRAMNAAVKIHGRTENDVASSFLASSLGLVGSSSNDTLTTRVGVRTKEHLWLTSTSLLVSLLLGLPLGVACARVRRLRVVVMGIAGVVQTIPSLALLVVMIPLLGIGAGPAIAALVLYSLFPVIEGTVTGLLGIAPQLVESADALGLPPWRRLWDVDVPLASPSIVSGIRTAAVLGVGTATLGAMVGAGGYGQPILTGVRLDSVPLLLEGALPAAALSLIVQGVFRFVEAKVVPRGLRADREGRGR